MNRREVIALLGGAAFAWPLAARAQQQAVPVVGFLGSGTADSYSDRMAAFRQGLSLSGFNEGQNVAIEYRWAEGQYDRLQRLAVDLVARHVAVIFASTGLSASAAKAATTTVPIVFTDAYDPVKSGLVTSLNRPGGNMTGVYMMSGALSAKRFELVHQLVPKAAIIALLVNPTNANTDVYVKDVQEAARSIDQEIVVLYAGTASDVDAAFTTLLKLRADALLVSPDPFFNAQTDQLAALAARVTIPTVYEVREFVVAGGLMSYAPSFADEYRKAGIYTARILKGEQPGDLPVQQPTKFDLVINLKTAKALGLAIPPTLLALADEVIE